MNSNNVQGPPPARPIPQNHGPPRPNPQNPVPDLQLMEELLQAPTDDVMDEIVVPPFLLEQPGLGLKKNLQILSQLGTI
ncbi:hypothetical protein Tco_1347802 [Tanacetum coccineum]